MMYTRENLETIVGDSVLFEKEVFKTSGTILDDMHNQGIMLNKKIFIENNNFFTSSFMLNNEKEYEITPLEKNILLYYVNKNKQAFEFKDDEIIYFIKTTKTSPKLTYLPLNELKSKYEQITELANQFGFDIHGLVNNSINHQGPEDFIRLDEDFKNKIFNNHNLFFKASFFSHQGFKDWFKSSYLKKDFNKRFLISSLANFPFTKNDKEILRFYIKNNQEQPYGYYKNIFSSFSDLISVGDYFKDYGGTDFNGLEENQIKDNRGLLQNNIKRKLSKEKNIYDFFDEVKISESFFDLLFDENMLLLINEKFAKFIESDLMLRTNNVILFCFKSFGMFCNQINDGKFNNAFTHNLISFYNFITKNDFGFSLVLKSGLLEENKKINNQIFLNYFTEEVLKNENFKIYLDSKLKVLNEDNYIHFINNMKKMANPNGFYFLVKELLEGVSIFRSDGFAIHLLRKLIKATKNEIYLNEYSSILSHYQNDKIEYKRKESFINLIELISKTKLKVKSKNSKTNNFNIFEKNIPFHHMVSSFDRVKSKLKEKNSLLDDEINFLFKKMSSNESYLHFLKDYFKKNNAKNYILRNNSSYIDFSKINKSYQKLLYKKNEKLLKKSYAYCLLIEKYTSAVKSTLLLNYNDLDKSKKDKSIYQLSVMFNNQFIKNKKTDKETYSVYYYLLEKMQEEISKINDNLSFSVKQVYFQNEIRKKNFKRVFFAVNKERIINTENEDIKNYFKNLTEDDIIKFSKNEYFMKLLSLFVFDARRRFKFENFISFEKFADKVFYYFIQSETVFQAEHDIEITLIKMNYMFFNSQYWKEYLIKNLPHYMLQYDKLFSQTCLKWSFENNEVLEMLKNIEDNYGFLSFFNHDESINQNNLNLFIKSKLNNDSFSYLMKELKKQDRKLLFALLFYEKYIKGLIPNIFNDEKEQFNAHKSLKNLNEIDYYLECIEAVLDYFKLEKTHLNMNHLGYNIKRNILSFLEFLISVLEYKKDNKAISDLDDRVKSKVIKLIEKNKYLMFCFETIAGFYTRELIEKTESLNYEIWYKTFKEKNIYSMKVSSSSSFSNDKVFKENILSFTNIFINNALKNKLDEDIKKYISFYYVNKPCENMLENYLFNVYDCYQFYFIKSILSEYNEKKTSSIKMSLMVKEKLKEIPKLGIKEPNLGTLKINKI